jgi:hypothetical protein
MRTVQSQATRPAVQTLGGTHGLINYEDTKTKCRLYWCLIVYRLEIQSVNVGIFDLVL